jgi:hypothetical protein
MTFRCGLIGVFESTALNTLEGRGLRPLAFLAGSVYGHPSQEGGYPNGEEYKGKADEELLPKRIAPHDDVSREARLAFCHI